MARVCEVVGIEGLTIHDFRRGWNDWAVVARVDKDIRDRVLHHASAGVTETNYTTVDYAELTREPMQAWSAYVVKSAADVKAKLAIAA
jgi:integrase